MEHSAFVLLARLTEPPISAFSLTGLEDEQRRRADSLAMVLEDHARPDRLILIGESRSRRLIFTVYAEQQGDLIRIISARKTTRAERRKYEEGEF